jgi:hypothetical protein
MPRLNAMLGDSDQRVVAAVLNALVKIGAPNAGSLLLDPQRGRSVVRAAAATGLGELRAPAGAQALPAAYQYGLRDSTYVARAAVVDAFAKYGITSARSLLDAALADKDWAVRVKAGALLKQADPAVDTATRIRPAPSHLPAETYQAARLISPPVSTQAYIDTDRGTIRSSCGARCAADRRQLHHAGAQGLLHGLTFHRRSNFVVQAGTRGATAKRSGYTIRDEINERPYLADRRRPSTGPTRGQPVLHHALTRAAPRREPPAFGRVTRHGRGRSDSGRRRIRRVRVGWTGDVGE